jgi:ribosomal protein S18 acetylase RimI-like enzyme
MIHVRSFIPDDRSFVHRLGPRLSIGIQTWRDLGLWQETVEEWIAESINQHNQKTMVLVAVDEKGERLGFATVSHSKHFTGQPQASIGELVIRETVEGQGVGTALVRACEKWGRQNDYQLLTLTTGAGNDRALGFYRHLGFHDEDITLTKQL